MQRKAIRMIRKVIYRLKRDYGFPITFYKVISETLNLETGERTPVIDYIKIKRAIALPSQLQQKFEYDLAYIAAAKNFTYGGLYDTSLKRIIIDGNDLGDFIPDVKDYFIMNERRWEVGRVDEFGTKEAFLILGKEVKGAPRYMIEDFNIETAFQLNQEAILT